MVKGKSFLLAAGISVATAIVFICAIGSLDVKALSNPPDEAQPFTLRADIITFDVMDAFGKLEKPKAVFLHDQHTDALEKKKKDCTACHKSENGRMSLYFMRLKEVGREELTKIYCDNCTRCHSEMKAAGDKAGPVECKECHKEKPLIKSSRAPMGFDKSLHFRHYSAQKQQCDLCHHEYDPAAKKLFYAKGKEGTCRYCHLKEASLQGETKVSTMRVAAHMACIDCHQKTRAKQMAAGPARCAGCHDPEQQGQIEKMASVPRLERGQPDEVLIKTGDPKDLTSGMMRVPFTHKAHEAYNDTCRVCHLASLEACVNCHPLTPPAGDRKIPLKNAFHKIGHQSSCIGCHAAKQSAKECAGCHDFMPKGDNKESATCLRCHMAPPPQRTGVLTTSKAAKMANIMPQLWQQTFGTIKVSVPEKTVIKDLVDHYEAVEYPHRKVFNTLVKQMENSKLATYFHSQELTLCLGCHHNSPASGNPPRCGNCHGAPFDQSHLGRPGITASYHQQCIGCHQKMGITQYLSCTACHKEKKPGS